MSEKDRFINNFNSTPLFKLILVGNPGNLNFHIPISVKVLERLRMKFSFYFCIL